VKLFLSEYSVEEVKVLDEESRLVVARREK